MKRFLLGAVVVGVAVAVEVLWPGHALYHYGSYNVALAALVVVVPIWGRRYAGRANGVRARTAVLAVVLGTVATGIAGVANGLFAPDDRTYVGAPGEHVRVEGLGTLVFPLASQAAALPEVALERPLRPPLQVGTRARNAGSFILRATPRSAVYVEARDAAGDRLTITQPQGAVFLSPVLLMQHQQKIEGMDLPFDSFNIPAAHRIVRAIMFTPAQAALLARAATAPGEGAVLFVVDDESDRPVPHGIALSAGGRPVSVGGLVLRGTLASYPQVDVLAAPNLIAVAIGSLLIVAGLAGTLLSQEPRTKSPNSQLGT
ncbi:MAG TPA: hypothetical protein VGX91_01690 [Candidatus Cybelea sp.]|nr:hypothetical protein [Candidatus Cybelea sp.]